MHRALLVIGDTMEKYDVFISHASKDKEAYVDKLAETIKKTGLTVFYDSDCIAWGDSISSKVEEGLSNCKRAVVVISKNYFGRKWTEYELMSRKRQIFLRIFQYSDFLYNCRRKIFKLFHYNYGG